MLNWMAAAEKIRFYCIDEAPSPIRVFLTPNHILILLKPGEFSPRILSSQFVGLYNCRASVRWIAEDIVETALGREETFKATA